MHGSLVARGARVFRPRTRPTAGLQASGGIFRRPPLHRATLAFVTGTAYQMACRLPKIFSFLPRPPLTARAACRIAVRGAGY